MEWRGGSDSSLGLRRAGFLEPVRNWRQPARCRKAPPVRGSLFHHTSLGEAPKGKRGQSFAQIPNFKFI